MTSTRAQLLTQAIRFAMVGGLATLAHFVVMAAMISAAIASPLAATFTGSLVGSVVAYLANRRHTFESDVPHSQALPWHYAVVAASMALTAALGLCAMMLCAMWVRIRIRDPLTGFLQAFVCFVLNLYILREQLLEVLRGS